MAGLSTAQAITLIGERRSPGALFDEHFVQWCLANREAAVAASRADSPSAQRAA